MGLIDFILNLAGLLLWLNWLSIRLDPLARPAAATLVGTLRKAGNSRMRRWMFGTALAALLLARTFCYWQIGAGLNWTPKLNLGVILLSFPLSFRGDAFGMMLLYSLLSFLIVLAGFYLWLVLLSVSGRKGEEADPFLRLVRAHLGPVARWFWPWRVALPFAGGAILWLVLSPVLGVWGIVPQAPSWLARIQQSALIGVSVYLAWKYLIVGLLALHLLHSYVYLGSSPFWNFVALAARSLLRPLRALPLRVDKVDLSPVVGLALVLFIANLAQNGQELPYGIRVPGLVDIYRWVSR